MHQDERQTNVFAEWFDTINAKQRAKSVCKPCWEIKYCPYGSLIEQFPFSVDDNDPRRCRVFGHLCPVFFVAEPLTETKELRNISRSISRPTQFRVLKRENQICRKCGQPVADDDIHFDHIIPWSKGGSSNENNIQYFVVTAILEKAPILKRTIWWMVSLTIRKHRSIIKF
ncbi:MAG: HNH endonuclease [Anaerolineae bacterium]|nr:HNH endonuclease [Anaerolineae bacterium]